MVINSIWAVLKVKTGQLVEKSRKLMQGMRAAVPLSQNALSLSQVYSLKQISVEMSSGKKKNVLLGLLHLACKCKYNFLSPNWLYTSVPDEEPVWAPNVVLLNMMKHF